jgi:uncharacterized HAD superfamily protein
MRIGIDLDDTICRTTEIVNKRLESYAKKNNLNVLDIMNDEDLKCEFFKENILEIYRNVEIKRDVYHVLKRLKSRGNEICVVTARGNTIVPDGEGVYEVTKEWLDRNNILVDGIFIGAYGENKAKVCKENNIDLMIDDDPYNYKMLNSHGVDCILFDDREKYDLRHDYFTNWIEIEKYIEKIVKE